MSDRWCPRCNQVLESLVHVHAVYRPNWVSPSMKYVNPKPDEYTSAWQEERVDTVSLETREFILRNIEAFTAYQRHLDEKRVELCAMGRYRVER